VSFTEQHRPHGGVRHRSRRRRMISRTRSTSL